MLTSRFLVFQLFSKTEYLLLHQSGTRTELFVVCIYRRVWCMYYGQAMGSILAGIQAIVQLVATPLSAAREGNEGLSSPHA